MIIVKAMLLQTIKKLSSSVVRSDCRELMGNQKVISYQQNFVGEKKIGVAKK